MAVRKKNSRKSSRKPLTTRKQDALPKASKSLDLRDQAKILGSKRYVIGALVLVVVVVVTYLLKGLFVAAIVNGQIITRLQIIQELERRGGKQTLTAVVTKSLVEQEAKRKNISISKKEIDDELKKVEQSLAKQGQTLNQYIESQRTTREIFVEQLTFQKLVEKLLAKEIQVTDKEVNDYFEKNQEFFDKNMTEEDTKKTIREQLRSQKLNTKFEELVSRLQKQAKISYFVEY